MALLAFQISHLIGLFLLFLTNLTRNLFQRDAIMMFESLLNQFFLAVSSKYASLKNLPIPNIFPQKRRIRPLFSVALLLPCHAIDNQNTRNARAVVFWAGFFHCPEGSPKLVLLHPSFSKFRFQGGESHIRDLLLLL